VRTDEESDPGTDTPEVIAPAPQPPSSEAECDKAAKNNVAKVTPPGFPCPHCDKTLPTENGRRIHLAKIHGVRGTSKAAKRVAKQRAAIAAKRAASSPPAVPATPASSQERGAQRPEGSSAPASPPPTVQGSDPQAGAEGTGADKPKGPAKYDLPRAPKTVDARCRGDENGYIDCGLYLRASGVCGSPYPCVDHSRYRPRAKRSGGDEA